MATKWQVIYALYNMMIITWNLLKITDLDSLHIFRSAAKKRIEMNSKINIYIARRVRVPKEQKKNKNRRKMWFRITGRTSINIYFDINVYGCSFSILDTWKCLSIFFLFQLYYEDLVVLHSGRKAISNGHLFSN